MIATSSDRVLRLTALVVPLLFGVVFYAYPVGAILVRGFESSTGERVGEVLSSASFRQVAWFSLWQALVSTALTMIVALPAAYVVARYQFWGRRALRAFVVVPFVLPTVVVAGAFEAVFARFGLDGGTIDLRHSVFAVLLAHVFFNYAVVVRVVGTFWEQLDYRPEQAARVLGATPLKAFRKVTLPRLRPALGSAAAIVFLFSFTSFGVILILGGPRIATVETEIWRYAVSRSEFDVAATLAVVQLIAVVALVMLTTRSGRTHSVDAVVMSSAVRRTDSPRQRLSLAGVIAMTVGLLGVPIFTLIERSLAVGDGYGLSNYQALTSRVSLLPTSPASALANSLLYATLAALIAATIGTLASLAASEGRGIGSILDIGLTLPLGTSAVTLGLGILIALDSPPLDFRSRWWIVPVVHSLIGIPFVLRSVLPALRGVGPNLRDVARTLGASPARVRREVDAPLAARAILVGTAFAFAVSLGEFGATSFVPRRPSTTTAPVAIFRLLGQPGDLLRGQAMALSVILMIVTALSALLIERSSGANGGLL
ncbi:MAG: iron ABC transporter permease [Acidimicrobiales bacterium]